jgi:hypothetical protein
MAARSLPVVVALLLVFSAALLFKGTAHAAPLSVNPPWQAYSYYVASTSNTTAYNHGCAQANNDDSHGKGSMVVLDFGGQYSDGSGVDNWTAGALTNAQVEGVAEAFFRGYIHCASISAAQLLLAVGTNNSMAVTSSLGNTWAHVAAAVESYVKSYTSSNMEPGFGSASAAIAWSNGYQGESSSALYDNFGSADGCPESITGANASCNNGWTVADEYYVAWGNLAALSTPEIYVSGMAAQWANISLYGAKSGTEGSIKFDGSMATPGYLTAAQAYTDLQSDINSHASTAYSMPYSLNITWNY